MIQDAKVSSVPQIVPFQPPQNPSQPRSVVEQPPPPPPPPAVPYGLIPSRQATQWYCGLIFFLLWVTIFILGVMLVPHERLDQPRDFDHNICTEQYPLLYVASFDPKRTVCVKNCPRQSDQPISCLKNSRFRFCPISRINLTTNKYYKLCYIQGTDITIHMRKQRYNMFAGSILESMEQIVITASITILIAIAMLFLTYFFVKLTLWIYFGILQVGLLILGVFFALLYTHGSIPYVHLTDGTHKQQIAYLVISIFFFLCSALTAITLFLNKHLKYYHFVLGVGKKYLSGTWYMLAISLLLCGLSIGCTVLLANMLEVTQSNTQTDLEARAAYNQLVKKQENMALLAVIAITYLWTHGVLIALSDFIIEGTAIIWYLAESARQYKQVSAYSFKDILKATCMHFGSICLQGALFYIPSFMSLFVWGKAPSKPILINFLIDDCHLNTIRDGQGFYQNKKENWSLIQRLKYRLKDMDMQGHLYRKLFKGALWVIGLMICLAFMIKDNYYYFGTQLFFIPSLIVLSLLIFQIGNHIGGLIGTSSDSITMYYASDIQLGREKTVPLTVRSMIDPVHPNTDMQRLNSLNNQLQINNTRTV